MTRCLLLAALMGCLLVANAQHGGGEPNERARTPFLLTAASRAHGRSLIAVPVRFIASKPLLGWSRGLVSSRVGGRAPPTLGQWVRLPPRNRRADPFRRNAPPSCLQTSQAAWAAASSPLSTPLAAAVSALGCPGWEGAAQRSLDGTVQHPQGWRLAATSIKNCLPLPLVSRHR